MSIWLPIRQWITVVLLVLTVDKGTMLVHGRYGKRFWMVAVFEVFSILQTINFRQDALLYISFLLTSMDFDYVHYFRLFFLLPAVSMKILTNTASQHERWICSVVTTLRFPSYASRWRVLGWILTWLPLFMLLLYARCCALEWFRRWETVLE